MNKDKWYSRLAKVIIWALTLGSLVFSIFTIYNNRYTKLVYNFEQNYESYHKKEKSILDSSKLPKGIWGEYEETKGEKSFREYMDKVYKNKTIAQYINNYPNNIVYDYKSWGNEIIELKNQGIDNDVIFNKLQETDSKKIDSIRFKMWDSVNFVYFLWLLLPVLVYFGLTLFYKKVILYIIFGNKN